MNTILLLAVLSLIVTIYGFIFFMMSIHATMGTENPTQNDLYGGFIAAAQSMIAYIISIICLILLIINIM